MRLLRLDNEVGDEFSLVEFIGTEIPPYAILSHTWSQTGGEVSYRDFVDGTGTSKAGYDKIRACGMQTAKKDLRYFWADTCCIDKTSSAELSEAINSMFRWYKEAEICFTYLEDVPPDLPVSEWRTADIRWFSRGWTLQELLAPSEVEFYASDWTFVGTKAKHCGILSKITGIHKNALMYRGYEDFSISQRMSWASSRTTTRPEDIAYCLLGLFDVTMPLLYGEGGTKAFIRLQEEIMRDSDDQSLFAWTLPRGVSSGLLAYSPVAFASSGSIVPNKSSRVSNPYSTTNSGLRITLPMFQERQVGNDNFYVAILACTDKGPDFRPYHEGRLVTLRLWQSGPGSDQYIRYSLIHPEPMKTPKFQPREKTIFVRSKNTARCPPSQYLEDLHPNLGGKEALYSWHCAC